MSDKKNSNSATVTIEIMDVNDNPPIVQDIELDGFTEEVDADVGPVLATVSIVKLRLEW